MASRSARLERVLRVRELQKRGALAEEGRIVAQRASLTAMMERIDSLRAAYNVHAGGADALLLKGMAHQHGRLQRPRDATLAQRCVVDTHLAAARAATLAAHRQQRAAEELLARARLREAVAAECKADREALPAVAHPLQRTDRSKPRGSDR